MSTVCLVMPCGARNGYFGPRGCEEVEWTLCDENLQALCEVPPQLNCV